MKITMFVTDRAMQFNLEPETEHEKEMLAILNKFKGEVSIKNGVDIEMCQGGYMRNFGNDSKILAITISKPEAKTNDSN